MATAGCEYPLCTNGIEATRSCSTPECEGRLHHFCFTSFTFRNNLPEPEGDDSYCWECVADLGECDAAVAADLDLRAAAAESQRLISNSSKANATPPPEDDEEEEAADEHDTRIEHNQSDCDCEASGAGEKPLSGGSCSWLRSNGRILMAFGCPSAWYGGVVKSHPDGDASAELYIAFDDGEIRKFTDAELVKYEQLGQVKHTTETHNHGVIADHEVVGTAKEIVWYRGGRGGRAKAVGVLIGSKDPHTVAGDKVWLKHLVCAAH